MNKFLKLNKLHKKHNQDSYRLVCPFSILHCKSGILRIQGLATTWNNADLAKDVLCKETFADQMNQDGTINKLPAMYYEHLPEHPSPGYWTCVKFLNIGIEVSGVVTNSIVIAQIQSKILSCLSIGFRLYESEKDYDERVIKKGQLEEISLVKKPANPLAFFTPVDLKDFKSISQESFTRNPYLG